MIIRTKFEFEFESEFIDFFLLKKNYNLSNSPWNYRDIQAEFSFNLKIFK